MYCVKKSDEIGVQFKHIALNERQWVVRLGLDVYPNNIETRVLVSHGSATRTTEQIKEFETTLASVFAVWFDLCGRIAIKDAVQVFVLCDIWENQQFIHPMHVYKVYLFGKFSMPEPLGE